MSNLLSDNHQGDSLPHLLLPDSAVSDVLSSAKDSSHSPAQVYESRTASEQDSGASREQPAAQMAKNSAYDGQSESYLVHSSLRNDVLCSIDGKPEGNPRDNARYESNGANSFFLSTANVSASSQPAVRLVTMRTS